MKILVMIFRMLQRVWGRRSCGRGKEEPKKSDFFLLQANVGHGDVMLSESYKNNSSFVYWDPDI